MSEDQCIYFVLPVELPRHQLTLHVGCLIGLSIVFGLGKFVGCLAYLYALGYLCDHSVELFG